MVCRVHSYAVHNKEFQSIYFQFYRVTMKGYTNPKMIVDSTFFYYGINHEKVKKIAFLYILKFFNGAGFSAISEFHGKKCLFLWV